MLLSWTPRLNKKCVKLNPWYSLINSFCFILFIFIYLFFSYPLVQEFRHFLVRVTSVWQITLKKKNGDWYKKKKFLIEWGNLHGYTLYLWEKKYKNWKKYLSLPILVFKFLKLIKKCSFPYYRTHLSTPYQFIVWWSSSSGLWPVCIPYYFQHKASYEEGNHRGCRCTLL